MLTLVADWLVSGCGWRAWSHRRDRSFITVLQRILTSTPCCRGGIKGCVSPPLPSLGLTTAPQAAGDTHELEEGGGEGQVHSTTILDALGNKHTQKLHDLADRGQVRGGGRGGGGGWGGISRCSGRIVILWPGGGEEAIRVLHIMSWGFGTMAQINLQCMKFVIMF